MKETVEIEMGETIVRAGVTIRPIFGGVAEVHHPARKVADGFGGFREEPVKATRSQPMVRIDLEYPDPAPAAVQ